jgi:hypothetical protein
VVGLCAALLVGIASFGLVSVVGPLAR